MTFMRWTQDSEWQYNASLQWQYLSQSECNAEIAVYFGFAPNHVRVTHPKKIDLSQSNPTETNIGGMEQNGVQLHIESISWDNSDTPTDPPLLLVTGSIVKPAVARVGVNDVLVKPTRLN